MAGVRQRAQCSLGHVLDQPFHALLQALPLLCRARLDVPIAIPDVVQPERIRELVRGDGVEKILLVGEEEEGDARQLLLLQQSGQLHTSLVDPSPISAINHVHQSISLIKVVPPVRADGLLTSNIPHVQLEALVDDRFDVEALGGHGVGDVLIGELL
eukprot:CAMPEP_0177706748 /NCGR_PEP_ID=MMETSP0484_2-20121128/9387_1 /TAXON_ID=354590 /ORGANISM="Rhodomonas lens, Strain RHODO" /LENGTH=156 /DNA_ID=CAMNT_0019218223 /DNA_START=129 /DNA_END=599 /DNA_ORIENTATION=-